MSLKNFSRTIVIGGGIIGTSVAYHLSLNKDWKDVTLIEQGSLTCGSTWHAAGIIGQMRNTTAEITLSKYGQHLYEELSKNGLETGFKKCGSLTLSSSPDRLIHLKRNLARAKSFGIEAELLSPEESFKKWPYFDIKNINGGLWLPNDSSADPTSSTMALATAAKQNGAKIYEKTRVLKINIVDGVVKGVTTDKGDIEAEVVVNCEIPKELPILRDLDGLFYCREWSGGLCMGGFEMEAKPCFLDDKPGVLEYHLFDEDWDQFDPIIQAAIKRIPILPEAGVRKFYNGPESFTSDNAYILGESPYTKNLFLACGFNSSGIASAGGAGLALSEWIIEKRPTRDLWTVDPRRFAKFQGTKKFLIDRVSETLGLHYTIPYPLKEYKTARNFRQSPLVDLLKQKGAFYTSKFGWERVGCYLPKDLNVKVQDLLYTWKLHPILNQQIKKEHINTRTNVSLFDETSFSKYLIVGKDALKALSMLTCNNIDVPINKIVYTPMLNVQGGYEADVTITRIAKDEFFILSPTAQTTRDMTRIKRFLQENDFSASIVDVTSSLGVLALMGPNSRNLLQSICEENISNKELPFGYSKEMAIGMSVLRVNRITYVGSLGYELYVPMDQMQYIYNYIHKHGEKYNLIDAGYYSIESLRIEKGYRAWAHEIRTDISPIETGLGFTIDWKKPDFIGKVALQKLKKEGINKKIFQFTIEPPSEEFYMLGDEPIFRDGKLVGYVTSTKFGYSLNKWVCFGLLKIDDQKITNDWAKQGNYQIEVQQKLINSKIHIVSPYDPKNAEILA